MKRKNNKTRLEMSGTRGSQSSFVSKHSKKTHTKVAEPTDSMHRFSFLDKMNRVLESARSMSRPLNDSEQDLFSSDISNRSHKLDKKETFKGKKGTKKKFKRKEFIKKLKKTDESLNQIEKKRENMAIDRQKFYELWDEISDKIIIAERKNCILKRKNYDLKMDNSIGIWESLRRNKNDYIDSNFINTRKLQKLSNNSQNGGLRKMQLGADFLSEKLRKTEKERVNFLQNMLNSFIKSGKKGLEEQERLFRKSAIILKEKEERLKSAWDKKVNVLLDEISNEAITDDRKLKLKENLGKNNTALINAVNVYKNVINGNFASIEILTRKLFNKMSHERHVKKIRERKEAEFMSIKSRLMNSKEKYSTLRKLIPTGQVVRANLSKVLNERKKLANKRVILAIEKEFTSLKNDAISNQVKKAGEDIKKELMKGKRNYYKQLISATEFSRDHTLSFLVYAQTIQNWWNIKTKKSSVSMEREFRFPEEGVNLTLRAPGPPPRSDVLEAEYLTAINVYDYTLVFFQDRMKRDSMYVDDLEFPDKKREIRKTYQDIIDEEERVFSIIKNDLKLSSRGT